MARSQQPVSRVAADKLHSSVDNNRPAQARHWCAQHGYKDCEKKKKSCVAATYRGDYIAATQLFIFDGGFENLWPHAPYDALAIGYYSKRCSAAHLPLRGNVSKKNASPPISPSARQPSRPAA